MILRWILYLVFVRQSYEIKCWTCKNAKTNEDCHKNGSLRACDRNEVYCQSEVRIISGQGRQINKQCKQEEACINNQFQNSAGLELKQCEGDGRQSVCRCCCGTDNCNGPTFQCGTAVEMCERPPHPKDGKFACPREVKNGTTCTFRCNRGFAPAKKLVLRCITQQGTPGRFTNANSAKCVRLPPKCKPFKTVLRGIVRCKNSPSHANKKAKRFEGTICDFSCNRNTFLSGYKRLTCQEGKWSYNPPTCVKGTCPIPPRHDHTFSKCTARNYFGSRCRYQCERGYKIIGNQVSRCRQRKDDRSRGQWTNKAPRCMRIQCPVLVDPRNGKVSCTVGNIEGSVCQFTCNEGFVFKEEIAKSIDSHCQVESNGIGKWSRSEPQCISVVCTPITKQIAHGFVLCTRDNRWGSSCIYKCNVGYDLDKTVSKVSSIFCNYGKDGTNIGEWSGSPASCSPVRCMTPRRAPLNGYVTCSNSNYAGSVCSFRCKRGFDLSKTTTKTFINTCVDERFGVARGEWSQLPASCRRRIHCKRKINGIPNGQVKCSAGDFVGSSCRFTCNNGYRLLGKEYVTCVELIDDGNDIAQWTDSMPTCVPKHCPRLWFDTETVEENCTNSLAGFETSTSVLGSVCQYSCKRSGFYALRTSGIVIKSGKEVCVCLPTLNWSGPPPRCFIKTCQHLQTPQHGYEPICTKNNEFGSYCEFGCKYGYKLSHDLPLVCIHGRVGQAIGKWHMPPPVCVAVK